MMLKVGLTGPLGSGKSTVCKILVSRGAEAIDVDRAGHDVLKDQAIREQLARAFGRDIFDGKQISRKRLGERVFAQKRYEVLNQIVHPPMIKRVLTLADQIQTSDRPPVYLVIDAALVFELGLHHHTDVNVAVDAPLDQIIERIKKRNQLDRQQILQRLHAQWPVEKKIALCDYVIENNGSLQELCDKSIALHNWLVNKKATLT